MSLVFLYISVDDSEMSCDTGRFIKASIKGDVLLAARMPPGYFNLLINTLRTTRRWLKIRLLRAISVGARERYPRRIRYQR